MKFIADLHVHSRFSRATARNLDLEHLYIAAQLKGITVVATGDFTHPGWFAELAEKLVPAEPGLFRLIDELASSCDQRVPALCHRPVRFILSTEISNIYKKEDRTRKNHNLVLLPDLEAVRRLTASLDKIGNLHSDGRPILGLDARDLLEMVLEADDDGYLVPAHIWTPWFSLLGSKSGFNSIEQCFEDLSEHIFAVETGLSSDPPMNWRVSNLDGRTLISNSDAHSPQKLGREANLFDTELSFFDIRSALKTGSSKRFLGTIEFFPEEGKYHLDGHRKCGLRIHPRETQRHKGSCPICGRPLTLGVLHRVEQLADRSEEQRPVKHHPYVHMIPLVEILADLFSVGPATKKVLTAYNRLLETCGPEDHILRTIDDQLLERDTGIPLLGEAIKRVREKRITVLPGYDGEFGRIRIFDPVERPQLGGQKVLFSQPPTDPQKFNPPPSTPGKTRKKPAILDPAAHIKTSPAGAVAEASQSTEPLLDLLNNDQRRAVAHTADPLLIVAGPGTGKTLTLTHRIAYLISDQGVDPDAILAVTFTQRAAQEMRTRLHRLMADRFSLPIVATFHSLCLRLLKENRRSQQPFRVIDEQERLECIRKAVLMEEGDTAEDNLKPSVVAEQIAAAKQHLPDAGDRIAHKLLRAGHISDVFRRYQRLLEIQQLWDYEDLIIEGIRLLESPNSRHQQVQRHFTHVLVDEYQDLNVGQYRLVKALAHSGAQLFVIGDPDQAIYGFRGSDVRFFNRFVTDFPRARTIHLGANYRSCQTILDASRQMIAANDGDNDRRRIYSGISGVPTIGIIEAHSEKAEAVAVGKSIEQLLGGIGFFSFDFGQVDGCSETKNFGFADIAVLSRTARQSRQVAEILMTAGIPCQLTSARHRKHRTDLQTLVSTYRLLKGVGSYLDLEAASTVLSSGLKSTEINHLIKWGIDYKCTVHQALETARRLPLPGLQKNSQRKFVSFIRKLKQVRHRLQDLLPRDQLEVLFQLLNLSEFEPVQCLLHNLEQHLRPDGRLSSDSLDLISEISLQTDTDRYDPRVEKVALLTMHAAKGLEFPVVFVIGCEDDLIPFRRYNQIENDIDEERRLFYVAMTRAKQLLFLTYSKKRNIFGRTETRTPSPFLVDIENRLKSFQKPDYGQPPQKHTQQLSLF